MSNKVKKLIFMALLVTALAFPSPSLAIAPALLAPLLGAIVGFAKEITQAIGDFTKPIISWYYMVLISYIVGYVSLAASAGFLENVLSHPEWLSVSNNNMVQSGWSFVAGLANMFYIVVFIIIAITLILKIDESFQLKKILPRLIIIALLTNFSLVFVGMLIDVSNVFYNTFLNSYFIGEGGQKVGLVGAIANPLIASAGQYILMMQSLLFALAITFVIPIFGPIAQLAAILAAFAAGGSFFPQLIDWLAQTVSMGLVSGIFWVYAFLFAARTFVIQMLAILSPLAFLCFILPQTKKYWDEWLKHLLEWIFFGIMLFFFMVIGLRALRWVVPPDISFSIPLVPGGGAIINNLKNYFFLFIYLVIILWLSRRMVPTIGGALAEQLGRAVTGTKIGSLLTRLETAAIKQRKWKKKKEKGEEEEEEELPHYGPG